MTAWRKTGDMFEWCDDMSFIELVSANGDLMFARGDVDAFFDGENEWPGLHNLKDLHGRKISFFDFEYWRPFAERIAA